MKPTDKAEEWCFFKELGEAVTRWSLIEYELYALATVLLKPKDRFVLWDAFTGIENFRSKLAFVERSFYKAIADSHLRTEWQSLHKEITSRSSDRNQLVHRTCISYVQARKPGRTISLEPSYRRTQPMRFHPIPPQDALCVMDIHRINRQFLELFWRITRFAHKVAGKQDTLSGTFQSPPTARTTYAALKRRMYEELSPPGAVAKSAAKNS